MSYRCTDTEAMHVCGHYYKLVLEAAGNVEKGGQRLKMKAHLPVSTPKSAASPI